MPIYEMIETIILCYLQTGLPSGTFGSVSRADNGTFTVSTSGRTFTVSTSGRIFTVRSTVIGWAVTSGHFIGEDADLIEAARLAVTA